MKVINGGSGGGRPKGGDGGGVRGVGGVAIAYRWRWYSWWRVEMVAGGDGGGSGGGTGSGDVVMACGGDEKWHGEGQGGVLGDLHNRQ